MRSCNPSTYLAMLVIVAIPGSGQAADPARAACYADAKRLCPEAVRALSRKRAEACLAAKIDQTSSSCHAMILKVRDERSINPSRRNQ